MVLVVADTGPINYLIQIGCIELLASLADSTVLPGAVHAELSHPAAPDSVRAWAGKLPVWAVVKDAAGHIDAPDISATDREAIALARELRAKALLMDDQQARRCAAALGVPTMGTVGILEAAAAKGLVDLQTALSALRETSCYVSEAVIENALARDAARKRNAR
jgi:predicted nucleic acid-binding protein